MAGLVLAFAAGGRAQAPGGAPAPTDEPGAAPKPDEPGAAAGADVGFRKGAQLSGEEQNVQAQEYKSKMQEIMRRIETLVATARREKDIIKLNCVNDKLIQVKGLMNVADQAIAQMQQAGARRDEAARNHEFSRLTIVQQKVLVLGQEAETCVGEELAFVEATEVETTIDPDITEQDPTQPVPFEPIIERPPTASPYN